MKSVCIQKSVYETKVQKKIYLNICGKMQRF